jgi:prepilin-type N-terminal cleavage/methylation domain-containing protein
MVASRRRGFTLIELLTVVAIISILAGILLPVLSGVSQRAALRAAKSNMAQMALALNTYFADNGTYPAGYGYMRVDGSFVLEPWHSIVDIYDNPAARDTFVDNHDANRDGRISMFEFLPAGEINGNDLRNRYWDDPYGIGRSRGGFDGELALQETKRRPFIYVPVNMNDFKKVKTYYDSDRGSFHAQGWNPSDRVFEAVADAIPTRYDAFVLIAAGPGGDIGGILPEPIEMGTPVGYDKANTYYTTALRLFYLATRDLNGNGELDYDWESRNGAGGDKPGGSAGYTKEMAEFPYGLPGAQGPLIHKSQ